MDERGTDDEAGAGVGATALGSAIHGNGQENYRILEGLLTIVHADGTVEPREVAGFKKIGELLGVGDRACELLLARFKSEGVPHDGR